MLNRCSTLAVRDKTPEEAWCGFKPSVNHFRAFGCIGHVHIPGNKRQKLDDRSFRFVLLGVSEESKAYRLYDPMLKKVVISKHVVFEEYEKWNWNKIVEEAHCDTLEWRDEDELRENEEKDSSEEEERIK